MKTCTACVNWYGELAPPLHRRQIVVGTRPAAQGRASRLAAATASWMARLMPTPPIGDMACAASPMQSRPGRYQLRKRSTVDGQQLDVVPDLAARRRGRPEPATARRCVARNASRPAACSSSKTPWGSRSAHCQYSPRSMHDQELPRVEPAERSSGSLACREKPHPQHVDRRADILDLSRPARAPSSAGRRRRSRGRRATSSGPSGVVARTPTTVRRPRSGR